MAPTLLASIAEAICKSVWWKFEVGVELRGGGTW
jgi:hypothetical protein